ncbi:MAG: GNAT family N-acetyltransferase [Anaerorhabdus sp.]
MSSILKRFKKGISNDKIKLLDVCEIEGCLDNGFVPSIVYDIYLKKPFKNIGWCDLRIGMNDEMYYYGNIGYFIDEKYRGNGYAQDACKLMFEVAKNKYLLDDLIITCSPDNIASKKTCENLHGELIETINVPSDHWLYKKGEVIKCIFKFNLEGKHYEKVD